MSTSSSTDANSSFAIAMPSAPVSEPIRVSDPPLPSDPLVKMFLDRYKSPWRQALADRFFSGKATQKQKAEFTRELGWEVVSFNGDVTRARVRIDRGKEVILTEKGREFLKWAVENVPGVMVSYGKLPSGVSFPKRRTAKLCDLLDMALEYKEKPEKEAQKAEGHDTNDGGASEGNALNGVEQQLEGDGVGVDL